MSDKKSERDTVVGERIIGLPDGFDEEKANVLGARFGEMNAKDRAMLKEMLREFDSLN